VNLCFRNCAGSLDKVRKNQLERLAKEVKGRMKVVEVSGEGAIEKAPVFGFGSALWRECRLRGVLRNFSEELSRCSNTLNRILWLRRS
jgi:hypothetical protein